MIITVIFEFAEEEIFTFSCNHKDGKNIKYSGEN